MKKIVFTTLLALALVTVPSVYAQSGAVATASPEKEYKKVESTQVPVDILKQVSARYSGFALSEAYASQDGEYKLVLVKDGKTIKAYYKATGEFVKDES